MTRSMDRIDWVFTSYFKEKFLETYEFIDYNSTIIFY